jgi:Sybindin-like family
MLTDTKAPSMRIALHQIWVNIYVEFVVKNPLSPVEHPGGLGVNNELFEASLEQFVVRWTNRFGCSCCETALLTQLAPSGPGSQRPLRS